MDETTLKTTNKTVKEYYRRYKDKKIVKDLRDEFMAMTGKGTILDVGVGVGRDTREFSKKGFEVTGIDVSKKMIECARKESPNSYLHEMDMTELNFGKNQFDGIWCCASLYHITKKEAKKVLKDFRRILKDKGILFIAVKEGIGEKYMTRPFLKGMKKFYALYEEDEMRKMLKRARLHIISVTKETKDQKWINIFAQKR